MKEEVCAVPYGIPPIIQADEVEEFLNMKPDEEAIKRHERLSKFDYIVTDNTKRSGLMERLTERNEQYKGIIFVNACTPSESEFKNYVDEVLEKLASYEDTKLQPKQVEKLKGKYKELQKENRKLKKEILKMLNHAWYNQEDDNEQE